MSGDLFLLFLEVSLLTSSSFLTRCNRGLTIRFFGLGEQGLKEVKEVDLGEDELSSVETMTRVFSLAAGEREYV